MGAEAPKERLADSTQPESHRPPAARDAVLIKVRRDTAEFFMAASYLSRAKMGAQAASHGRDALPLNVVKWIAKIAIAAKIAKIENQKSTI